MVNLGQLARERWGDDAVAIGFSSYEGSVIAGASWGAPMERMPVPAARSDSTDAALHEASDGEDALLLFDGRGGALARESVQRAIGVVYDPARERWGNYVPTRLGLRYDGLVHVDRSSALHPLGLHPERPREPPDTYPWGL
jgi:erythromycin esterase-like protein